jgi:putative restriction endonuclease
VTRRRIAVTTMMERPRAMEGSSPGEFEDLLRIVEELDLPGYKVEVVRGKIVASPWSQIRFMSPMRLLRRALEEHAPEGHIADIAPFLFAFPHASRAYGPDLYVADEAAFHGPGNHVNGAALSLVAEFTSVSTRDADWDEKVRGHGRQVPVYLLLDMQSEKVTMFWDPSEEGYQSRTTAPFGKSLSVPEPFGFELDTTGFTPASPEDTGPSGG